MIAGALNNPLVSLPLTAEGPEIYSFFCQFYNANDLKFGILTLLVFPLVVLLLATRGIGGTREIPLMSKAKKLLTEFTGIVDGGSVFSQHTRISGFYWRSCGFSHNEPNVTMEVGYNLMVRPSGVGFRSKLIFGVDVVNLLICTTYTPSIDLVTPSPNRRTPV